MAAEPESNSAANAVSMELGDDYPEIRDTVSKICAQFPGEYWRELDKDSAYPTAFVRSLTKAGFLAALIPETYGGASLPLRAASVILETIHVCGGNAAACHAQMYIMGTLLRHGSEAQKQTYLIYIKLNPTAPRAGEQLKRGLRPYRSR